jgi:hypothetical protein
MPKARRKPPLKARRENVLMMRLSDAAAQIGIHDTYLSEIENQKIKPSYWLIPKLAEFYGLSVNTVKKFVKAG